MHARARIESVEAEQVQEQKRDRNQPGHLVSRSDTLGCPGFVDWSGTFTARHDDYSR